MAKKPNNGAVWCLRKSVFRIYWSSEHSAFCNLPLDKRVPLAEGPQLTRPPALMRPSISGRLEDIVLELAAVLVVGAQVVPLAAARVAAAGLPSQAEGPA
jgi:hypothetical protein